MPAATNTATVLRREDFDYAGYHHRYLGTDVPVEVRSTVGRYRELPAEGRVTKLLVVDGRSLELFSRVEYGPTGEVAWYHLTPLEGDSR